MKTNLENFPDRGNDKYWKNQYSEGRIFDYTAFVHDVYAWKDNIEKELRKKLVPHRYVTGKGEISEDKTFCPWVDIKEILGD